MSLLPLHIVAATISVVLIGFLLINNVEQLKQYGNLRKEINSMLNDLAKRSPPPESPVDFTDVINNIVRDCVQQLMKEVQAVSSAEPTNYVCSNENACETICTECVPNVCGKICRKLKPCKKVKPIETLRHTNINYADAHLGARIIAVSGKPFESSGGFITSIWSDSYGSNPPDKILNSDMEPGSCFAFKERACVTISLSKPIVVEAIEIAHIQRSMSPTKDTSSAPKDFLVYGIEKETENEICLGHFIYENCEPSQMFSIEENHVFDFVKFEFISNHGSLDFTCVYKVGVYGQEEVQEVEPVA